MSETKTDYNTRVYLEDIAHIRFENPDFTAEKLLLLVSTPRSGSTMLSTDLDPSEACPMAEYLQPYQIIPYIVHMHPDLTVGHCAIHTEKYADYLKHYRAGRSGTLGINIHHSHIQNFNALENFLPQEKRVYILIRRNIVRQAISYYFAKETGQWTSAQPAVARLPAYNFQKIAYALQEMMSGVMQNLNRFAKYQPTIIFYEDYVAYGASFAEMNHLKPSASNETRTKKQSTRANTDMEQRFLSDIQTSPQSVISDSLDMYGKLLGTLSKMPQFCVAGISG